MIKTLSRSFITALFLIFLSINSFSQTNRQITGTVIDSTGAFVAGASVTLYNKASGSELNTETDASGNFAFQNLANGIYVVKIDKQGFSGEVKEVNLTGAATAANLNLKLSVGNISETVTVTATRTQLATNDASVPVTVLSREEIEEENVNTIGDVFRDLPGTSVSGEGAFQVRPRIRGLDSNRILILIDGERLNNARTSTGQSGIETGLVGTEQIETLEVVRGSGSVLYGTDALAGTVNIITKDAPRGIGDGFRFGGTFNGYYSSNENGRRGSLAVTGSSRFFSFRAAQSLERYDNYFTGDADGVTFSRFGGFPSEREVGNSQSHGGTTQLTTRFFFNDDNDLRLNYERRRASDIGSPLLTLDYGFNGYFPYSNRDKFNGSFETRNVTDYLARVSASFYVQDQKRNFSNRLLVAPVPPFFPGLDNFSETVTDTKTIGFDVQSNWILGSRNFLTTGISYFRDENEDSRLQERRRPVLVQDRSTSVPNADFGSFAAFAQDEFTLNDRLRLTGGIRVERFFSGSTQTQGFAFPSGIRQFQLDDLGVSGIVSGLNVKETAVTGDFGANYKIVDEVNVFARIGRSFRVANLFERFFTGAGSVGGFLVGNPNLEPETGINFDAGVKFSTDRVAGTFTYFNNYYRDFLSSQQAFDSRGCPVLVLTGTTVLDANGCRVVSGSPTVVSQTINLGRVRIQGFEADLEIPFRIGDGVLTPSGNISYLRGDDLDLSSPLNTITPFKTVLNLRWQDVVRNYYADVRTRIVNKQERLSPGFLASNFGPEPGFVVTDIGGGYQFKKERYRLGFNAGVQNLFNRFYYEQFNFAPARGRSFVFGTTISFF